MKMLNDYLWRSEPLLTNASIHGSGGLELRRLCLMRVDREDKLIWSADKKVSLFSAHCDAISIKIIVSSRILVIPIRHYVLLPSGVRSLLLNLNPYGEKYPDGMFPLFLQAGDWGAGT